MDRSSSVLMTAMSNIARPPHLLPKLAGYDASGQSEVQHEFK